MHCLYPVPCVPVLDHSHPVLKSADFMYFMCVWPTHRIVLVFTPRRPGAYGARYVAPMYHSLTLQALNELLEVTRSDIRACLNALQFLSRRTSRVTLSALRALGLASKDVTESAFTAWNQLFTSKVNSVHSLTTFK